VTDAHGHPPSIPFWLGEGPGRTRELSEAVSRLRDELYQRFTESAADGIRWLHHDVGLPQSGAEQLASYLYSGSAALGVMPTRETLVIERFFDEVGDMHVVLHSPFGSRLNKAWGLALRKCFCRSFNFELQAAANEDSIVISLGSVLMQYEWIVMIFGVFLILTGLKILFLPEKPIDPSRNPIILGVKKLFPVTPQFHGDKLWVEIGGKTWVTPLFVALVFIEFSDIIFAIDSVPAIFALTNEPFIVFTSNIFAIIGLRSLFFVLQSMVKAFIFLKYGLGLILVFVGLKMVWLNEAFGGKFPISLSLGIIGSILAVSIIVSLAWNRLRLGGDGSDDEGKAA
jgi:predicted tellurium resistance membrane protein TerC